MRIVAYKTHKIRAHEDLLVILDHYVPPLREGDVIAVTSKIVALCQGRVVPKNGAPSKNDLVKQEAEWFIQQDLTRPEAIAITIKEGILIASAGIDTSNAEKQYVLWPHHPQQVATAIWTHLKKRDKLRHFGVILTDSKTHPLRWGVTGVGLAWCGFHPLRDCRGMKDIWDQELRVTTINVLDGLAASAVLVMGESAEQTPVAVIHNAPHMHFLDAPPTEEETRSLRIARQDDLYAPLLEGVQWQKGEAKTCKKPPCKSLNPSE
ncbi:MAG: coenzyme F420-0:L-glutamate ligase [Holosporales bacterium]|jgi:putative folate metabolism gamma-glutamate ligase|nr:coenzyme F420-0:L-glutamate ligase [Holosporales bacterium]